MIGPRLAAALLAGTLVAAGTGGCALEERPSDRAGRQALGRAGHADGDRATHREIDRPTSRPAVDGDVEPPTPRTYVVTRVVDGDTLELGNGETVRLVGIDTPERGECGYDEAARNLADLVAGQEVTLTVSDEDHDRYDRLLRYVDAGALDAGFRQIRDGFAIARYDSRDGYGFHVRERDYVRADRATPGFTCAPEPAPATGGGGAAGCATGYRPCLPPAPPDLDCGDVDGPIYVTGSDPHRLDADGDGVACE